ncbi:MAG: hypothetical protein RIQ53_3709 [Pseudomonadota bacterium]
MFDYFKYLLSPALLGLHVWGLWQGGPMTWLGLAALLAILCVDMLLPLDFSERDLRAAWLYDVQVTATVVAGFVQIGLFAWWVGQGHFDTPLSLAGAFAGTALYGFVVAAPAVHELMHRKTPVMHLLGRIGLWLIYDPWREITHVVTHHLKVATPDDPDTARRGEAVYPYLVRSFVGQFQDAVALEREMWTKRGRAWWHPMNHWVGSLAGLAAYTAALVWLGGWSGAAWAIASSLVGPRLMLEFFNYVNHYGLVTDTPGQFQRRHTWNHLTPFVRILALEITNHAGHHEDPYKPFYRLTPDRDGPRQPHFLLCILAALLPPLWFALIKPRLRDWDERHATPRERELARQANRAAGWEDWLVSARPSGAA